MKKKAFKWITVVLTILALTMGNFILVAKNSISYAKELFYDTNNKNIEFMAYFKSEEGKELYSKEQLLTENNTKLYLRIAVKEDGYFNGDIKLQNSNINLKEDILSEKVNSIKNNTIVLNQINAGENVEIEVGIDTNIDYSSNVVEANKFDTTSSLVLSGTYVNAKKTYEDILATSNVNLKIISPEDIKMYFKSDILMNKVYEIEKEKTEENDNEKAENNIKNEEISTVKEKKRYVSILLESGLEENKYPIDTTTMEITVPKEAEDVTVTSTRNIRNK